MNAALVSQPPREPDSGGLEYLQDGALANVRAEHRCTDELQRSLVFVRLLWQADPDR
jgi:hypothetical protein